MALSGYEKAAIFLTAVGEDVAAQIMKEFAPEQIGKISVHMARLNKVEKAQVESILNEISNLISEDVINIGGKDYVKKVLSKGLKADEATRILEMVSKESPLDSLKWVSPKTLAAFLATEHPQTIALILCMLEPAHAAEIMSLLPEQLREPVAIRVANTENISESAIAEIEEVLKGQLDIGKNKGKKVGGNKALAEILNNCNREIESNILGRIESHNSELADTIRQLMFIFEDLINVDDKGIQAILKETTTEELSIALKTASDKLKGKIFKNMSQRAGEILKEEMQTRGPVRVTDVEKAQQNIVKIAKRLDQEGKIVIAGRGKDEIVE